MTTTDNDEVLDGHIEEIRGGADPADVLERCPEHLRGELRTAIAITEIGQVVPPRGARERLFEDYQGRRFSQKKAA